jgi:hypothetical protein
VRWDEEDGFDVAEDRFSKARAAEGAAGALEPAEVRRHPAERRATASDPGGVRGEQPSVRELLLKRDPRSRFPVEAGDGSGGATAR